MMASFFSFKGKNEKPDESEKGSNAPAELRSTIDAAAAVRKKAEIYITWLERALTPVRDNAERQNTEPKQ